MPKPHTRKDAMSTALRSEDWRPTGEVRIIAGTPPGGGLDRTARALAEALTAAQQVPGPVQVINVPGDGARNAWRYMDSHAGDPHVVSISHPNLTTDYLTGAADFDHTAYTPIAILYNEYIAFVARADSPLRRATDLLERLHANPAGITAALSTALGNPNHIALARVTQHAGGDVRAPAIHVFDSALDAVADVASGSADVAAVTAASVLQALETGTVRVLAISSPERLDAPFAGTPTWRELGVNCEVGAWRGVTGAHGIGAPAVTYWQRACSAAAATAAWKRALARHCWAPMYLDGDALRRYLEAENRDMETNLRDLGLIRAASGAAAEGPGPP
jgi:putative tricarboxylic transport membrane protein